MSASPFTIGFQDARVIVGIVFQVPVLNQHDVAGGQHDAGADGGALSVIPRRVMPHYQAFPRMFAEHLGGSVGGTVIHHHNLFGAALGQRRLADALQNLVEGVEFVVHGNDDGDLHGFSRTTNSDWPKGGGTIPSRRDISGTT